MKSPLFAALLVAVSTVSSAGCYYSSPFVPDYGPVAGTWVLGTPFPMLPNFTNDDGYQLFCYGPELAHVRAHFTGVPMHDGTFLVWHNSNARFILEGLAVETRS
jgi:hypothetical protein